MLPWFVRSNDRPLIGKVLELNEVNNSLIEWHIGTYSGVLKGRAEGKPVNR